MFGFSQESKGAARSGDMTVAPRAPVEQPSAVVQRWQRGGAGGQQPRQRGHLEQHHQDERDDPERADVAPAHQQQRLVAGPAGAESVGGVREPVAV